jgi:hypothetical protein
LIDEEINKLYTDALDLYIRIYHRAHKSIPDVVNAMLEQGSFRVIGGHDSSVYSLLVHKYTLCSFCSFHHVYYSLFGYRF